MKIMVSKYHSPKKEPGIRGDMDDSRTRLKKNKQDNLSARKLEGVFKLNKVVC